MKRKMRTFLLLFHTSVCTRIAIKLCRESLYVGLAANLDALVVDERDVFGDEGVVEWLELESRNGRVNSMAYANSAQHVREHGGAIHAMTLHLNSQGNFIPSTRKDPYNDYR